MATLPPLSSIIRRAEKSSESMASPPPFRLIYRIFLGTLHIIAQMMGMSDASIGSSTASTNFDTCPSTQADCSDLDDSNPSSSTAAEDESEDEKDTSPAGNLGQWHQVKDENLKKEFKEWQKYESLEGSESSMYEVITDKGTFFTVKEISSLDERHQDIWRSLQEIEFRKQLEHENIVRYLGLEKDNEKFYIFFELMSRGSLSTFYRKYGLIESQASTHTRKVLEVLKYLHSLNVIHRNIRCAMILVGESGSVKLDLGLANAISLNDANSFSEIIFWMAPEVVRNGGNGSYGSAADIWSLGCTVLEMLTCKPPFSSVAPEEVYWKIMRGEVPEVPKYLSRDAQNFIRRCLQVNPNDRPSAEDLLNDPFVKQPPTSIGFTPPHFNNIGS